MKKLSVVAVAVCLCVGASFASWDKFSVIDDGSAEAKFGVYNGGVGLNVRYGLLENLELYSTLGKIDATGSNYTVGARYQIIPMLSAFLDIDFPTKEDGGVGMDDDGVTKITRKGGSHDLGLLPGINFTMPFTDKISFGSVLQLGYTMADTAVIDFGVGIEVDIMFSDNIGMWIGADFQYDRLTQENREDLDIAAATTPGFGFFFTKDALTIGTLLEFDLAHPKLNKDTGLPDVVDGKLQKTVGLKGSVEFAVKF
jgi:hypothetical protein